MLKKNSFLSWYGATWYLLVVIVLFSACGQPPADAQGGPMTAFQFFSGTIYFFLRAFLCYWMLVLRPNEVEEKKREEFLKNLQKGTEVITSSGIIAKVISVKPEYISLEIAPNTKIKIKPEHVSPLKKENDQQSKK